MVEKGQVLILTGIENLDWTYSSLTFSFFGILYKKLFIITHNLKTILKVDILLFLSFRSLVYIFNLQFWNNFVCLFVLFLSCYQLTSLHLLLLLSSLAILIHFPRFSWPFNLFPFFGLWSSLSIVTREFLQYYTVTLLVLIFYCTMDEAGFEFGTASSVGTISHQAVA